MTQITQKLRILFCYRHFAPHESLFLRKDYALHQLYLNK